MNDWEVTIVRTFKEIEAIRDIWEQMQHNESSAQVNADYDRYLSVLKAAGDNVQPYIILIEQKGHPMTMVIARIDKRRIICRIGYLKMFKPSIHCISIVYGGILGRQDNKACSILTHEFMKILKRGDAELILLNYLSKDSPLYHFSRKIPGFLNRDFIPVKNLHWQTPIPGNKELFHKMLSRNERRNIRRHTQQLEKKASGPVTMKSYHNLTELDELISIASKISSVTYQHNLTGGFTDNNLIRSLLTHSAKKNLLRAYILYAGSEPIAYELGTVYNSIYFAEFRGFHPDWSCGSPGSILLLKVLEEFSQDPDIMTYDYGFGDAPYKQRYGKICWHEASVCIFALRFYPICVNILRTCVAALNSTLEYAVNKSGLTNRIKRLWRNRLEKKTSKNGF